MKLLKPDGFQLALLGWHSANGGVGENFLDVQTLPMTGTYTIVLDPVGNNTGQATVTVYNVPAENQGTIVAGGAPVTVSTTVPGQNGRLTFTGAQDQIVSARIANSTYTDLGSFSNSVWLNLIKPDGTVLATTGWHSANGAINTSGTTSPNFLDAVKLPVAGTYTLQVDPTWTLVGGAALTLFDVPAENQGTITPGGAAVNIATSVPGQKGSLTFTGSLNQRISVRVTGSTYPNAGSFTTSATLKILKPDGTQLSSMGWHSANGGVGENFLDTVTLPVAGTYTLQVDSNWTYTGQATLALLDVPAENQGTITPGGAAVNIVTPVPGQNGSLTFTGSLNQRISVRVTGSTYPDAGSFTTSATLKILKPDGTQLASMGWHSANGGAGENFLDTVTLPMAGTYTLRVDPNWNYTGQATITLFDVPAENQGTITPGGEAVTVTATIPGQSALLTFNATAGQNLALQMTGVTITSSTVSILKPDGTTYVSTNVGQSGGTLYASSLPVSGVYGIFVNPSSTNTGNITLTLGMVSVTLTSSPTTVAAGANVTATWSGIPFPTSTGWLGLYTPGAADNAH